MPGHCGVDTSNVRISEGDSTLGLFALHCHGHANGPLGFCYARHFSVSTDLEVTFDIQTNLKRETFETRGRSISPVRPV